MPAPLKSGQSVETQWRTVNRVDGRRQFAGNESINTQLRQAGQPIRPADTSGVFYPFKIYSYPSVWRATPAIATDWLKFRIHGGRYQSIVVAGTDGVDVAGTAGPDAQIIPAEADGGVTEYTLATGHAAIYFWIDATTTSAPVIKFGYVGMAVSGNGGDPVALGWTNYPIPDGAHIPIGIVDTSTDATDHWAHVRQLLRHDISLADQGPCT